MKKRGKSFLIMIAVMVQIMISILYGFSDIQIPATGCFAIWCICAVLINKAAGVPKTV